MPPSSMKGREAMKRLFAYLLTAAILLGLAGCKSSTPQFVDPNFEQPPTTPGKANTDYPGIGNPPVSTQTSSEVQYCAQYIRTDGYQEGALFPKVQIIQSLRELKDYYTAHKEVFNLERREKVYADTTIGFLDACDQYNEVFFEENYLLFVLLEEGSGSVRHEIRSITQTRDKKISISVDRKVPEAGTDDMAEWHIILELSREIMVETPEDVQVYLDGNLAWNGSISEPHSEGAFKEPPAGKLITPDGEASLHLGGYSWFCTLTNDLEEATIADQAGRPIPADLLETVTVNSKYAETVYAPTQGSSAYAPTNSLGYLVKLDWEVNPTSVIYTCWPKTAYHNSKLKEEAVIPYQDFSFYANPGSYIYEIVANWEDTGAGYHGTANYYVFIVEVNEPETEVHPHGIASDVQTVDDPFIGYCGNTWTTLHIGDKEYSFMFGHSITLTDILINLDYDPDKLCKCLPEYTVNASRSG